MNAPCYRCARRAINCHTACTDYAEYRKVCNQMPYCYLRIFSQKSSVKTS